MRRRGITARTRSTPNQPASIRRLTWGATIGFPNEMGLSMQYRYRTGAGNWSEWSDPEPSENGPNQIDLSPPPSGMRYFQYQANFTTAVTIASPLLDWVEVYYDVPNPRWAWSRTRAT